MDNEQLKLSECSVCNKPPETYMANHRFALFCPCLKVVGKDWIRVIRAWQAANGAVHQFADFHEMVRTEIVDLNLSVNLMNRLRNAGCAFGSDAWQKTEQELLRIKGFGRRCLEEWRSFLGIYGLKPGGKKLL
jgi:DNA-directed RNA polymerase alpha subunit